MYADLASGSIFSIEHERVSRLITGLDQPKGVATDLGGACYATETGAGRVIKIVGGAAETVLDGLQRPEGTGRSYRRPALCGRRRRERDPAIRPGNAQAANGRLPPTGQGAPPGILPKALKAVSAALRCDGAFLSDITAGNDGTLYVSGDAEGSVLRIRLERT